MRLRSGHLLVAAGLLCALQLVLESTAGPIWLQRVPQRMFAFVGLMMAAVAFDRGDPPRRVWLLMSLAPVCGIAAGPLVGRDVLAGGIPIGAVVIVVANALWVVALALLWRLLCRSGLATPWTMPWRFGFAAVVAVSLSMTLPTVVAVVGEGVPQSITQWTWVARRLVGVSADATTLCLAFLLARVVLPMRGGRVAGPYFMVAAGAALMLITSVGLALGGEVVAQALGPGQRLLEVLAWCLLGAAGLLQRQVITGMTAAAGGPRAANDAAAVHRDVA